MNSSPKKRIILADTNAAIKLAIAFPELLKHDFGSLRIIITQKVRDEIDGLLRNPKKTRIAPFLRSLRSIPVASGFNEPSGAILEEYHRDIIASEDQQRMENAANFSAPSSSTDRLLLILALENEDCHLLTSEGTLSILAHHFLGSAKTWNVGKLFKVFHDEYSLSKKDIHEAISRLDKEGEFLSRAEKRALRGILS